VEDLNYKIKREKFLCEAMGICWHENFPVCDKCGEEYDVVNFHNSLPDFSTWEGFGKLFEWVKDQRWYAKLCFTVIRTGYSAYPGSVMSIPDKYIDPDIFADAVYEYLSNVAKEAKND
jgi:hypothetical protein